MPALLDYFFQMGSANGTAGRDFQTFQIISGPTLFVVGRGGDHFVGRMGIEA
jgi:hypothetical protein